MEGKKDKNLLNYVKEYTIPKKEPKYEDLHIVVPLGGKKVPEKKKWKTGKKAKKKKGKLKRVDESKTNNIQKQEDKKEPNKNIPNKSKEVNIDELLKKFEEKNKFLKDQLQHRINNIIRFQKKYEDQENIIKNLELIISEQKEKKEKNIPQNEISNNGRMNDLDIINEILASEMEDKEPEKFDDDILYDDDFQEQFAIDAVEQQIMDELYPNPDSMSYEQLLQLEDNMGHVNKGLSKNQIDKLPIVKYDKDKYSENYQCIICMEEFEKKEKVKLLPCGHIFHDNCIKQWLLKQKTCPFCKGEIR